MRAHSVSDRGRGRRLDPLGWASYNGGGDSVRGYSGGSMERLGPSAPVHRIPGGSGGAGRRGAGVDDPTPLSSYPSPSRPRRSIQVAVRVVVGFGALYIPLSIGLKKGSNRITSLSNKETKHVLRYKQLLVYMS